MTVDDDAFAFFTQLSGILTIELSEPAQPVSPHVMNRVAPKTAKITRIEMDFDVFIESDGSERALTDAEWSRVVARQPTLRMCSSRARDVVVEHESANGAFTIRDLADAIAKTERATRERGGWLGGIDVHHVFFEGVEILPDGVWALRWGS